MLSNKQIKTLAEDKRFDWTDRRCFTDNFQKHDKPGTQRLSVLELDEAYKNSQDVYDSELIPFLRSKVKNLSKEIFVSDEWLIIDPKVAEEAGTGKLHLIGGRHRLFAIKGVLEEMGKLLGIGNQIFHQLVRVEFISGVRKADIPKMVLADNESRVVKKAERYNLLALNDNQTKDPEDFLRRVFAAGYTPKVAIDTAATYFNSKKSKVLNSGISYGLGGDIVRYVLFGIVRKGKPVTKATPRVVKSISELKEKADRLWGCCEIVAVQNKELKIEEIFDRAIELYERG